MATGTGDDKKKKIAALSWKRGSEAMGKEQWDFAIEMFTQSVSLVPDNLMYRQTLRGVQYKKYNNNKVGKRMAGMSLMKIRARIKKAKSQRDWETVDRAAEEGLALNPWDAQLNADMAEACKERGFDEVAVFGFEKAVLSDPENKKYNRELARLQELRGNFGEAIKAWQRIRKADPLDGEARSKITQLGASSAMQAGGYENATSSNDVKTQRSAYDEDLEARSQKTTPGPADGPGESKEADLQRAIRKEPDNKDNYLRLADFYKREGQLDQSIETFKKALEVSGGDANIREQMEDVQLDKMRMELEQAKETARESGDEAEKKRAEKLRAEYHRREIDVLAARIERYPADMRIKFELAQRYMMFRKYQQAIPLLQRASSDNRLKCDVLVSLAKCFIADKKHPLAQRQLEKALPNINQMDQPDLFKEANYLMGRLCEKAGNSESAENHYSEVLAVDYEYKDTLQRLEQLQSGGGGNAESDLD